MFVSFRKCSRPPKPDPISEHNCQNLYPFSDQHGSKKPYPLGRHIPIYLYRGVPSPPPPGVMSSFRAISGHAIFYGSRSDSLKFSVSLSAQGIAEVSSHNFQIKSVCFERLIKSLDSVFGNA